MAALTTPEVNIDWQAPDFSLLGTDGKKYTLSDVKGKNGLVVMFICNHCPFVKAILDKIIRDMSELQALGINAVAIMSNDTAEYPDDSFENMQELATAKNFPFPYLIDETQEVAKQYDAVCTPDFFGFNADLKLQYRGRLDDSGRDNKPDGSRDLFMAMSEIAKTGKGPEVQKSSIGCNIKWKN
jgi:peroxiredoxin